MSGRMGEGFLEQITADADDDTNRLVFSDWLEEQGEFDRAEFIRIQIQQSELPAWDAAQVGLKIREQELLAKRSEQWLKEMPEIPGVRWEGFRRGIVAVVSFASFEALRTSASLCRSIAPIESVRVPWPRRREASGDFPDIAELRELTLTGRPFGSESKRLADSPQLATVHVLKALGLDATDLERLAGSPHLKNLRTLCLKSAGVGTDGVIWLTEAATMTSLESLDLTGPGYYESYYDDPLICLNGLEALADWHGLKSVRSLSLSGSDVRARGLQRLLQSPNAAGLKSLTLRSGRLDGAAIAEFGSAHEDLNLEELDLGENILSESGAEHLAAADCLRDLRTLKIDRCEIPETGAVHFAKHALCLDGLRILEAGHNDFGANGIQQLLDRSPGTLHTLGLRNNSLENAGLSKLAQSAGTNELLEVDLGENNLTHSAVTELGATQNLQQLLILRVGNNPKLSAKTLATSPLGRRLKVLDADDAEPWFEGYLSNEEGAEFFREYDDVLETYDENYNPFKDDED